MIASRSGIALGTVVATLVACSSAAPTREHTATASADLQRGEPPAAAAQVGPAPVQALGGGAIDSAFTFGEPARARRAAAGAMRRHASAASDAAARRKTAPSAQLAHSSEARHPAPPQLRPAWGPVIAAPKIVPVIFPGDPYTAQITDFTSRLTGSQYWKTIVSEYGVGAGSALPPIVRTDVAPATILDVDIEAWLTSALSDPNSILPAPDPNTIYALYYPPGTTVEFAAPPGSPNAKSCTNFGAYHTDVLLPSGVDVAYAVMPRCASYRGWVGLDEMTLGTGHELAEASTDPYPVNWPAYDDIDFAGTGYALFMGSEVGDMCEFIPNPILHSDELGYTVQRMWSNASAAAGHDPCLPAANPTYFNVAPVVDGMETYPAYSYAGQYYPSSYAKGVAVPPGGEVTVELKLFSDGYTRPWKLSTTEAYASGDLTFTLDDDEGMNGDVRRLTIRRADSAPYAFYGQGVLIHSTLGAESNTAWLAIGY
jgi:hypothetical protein